MAVTKRNGSWFLYFRPFKNKKIGLKLLNVSKKSEANEIETLILLACRSGNYSGLDSVTHEACKRMFTNQGWELPPGLRDSEKPQKELTLWDATRFFLTYPEIVNHPYRWRYECALANLNEKLGKDTPVKSIWVPMLKIYQIERSKDGVAPATTNRELSTLSRLFSVLIENQLIETNPVRLVKSLSCKSGEREVYLSFQDVEKIAEICPDWFRPIVWTAYYTGMRRGELLGLKRKQVDLTKRMIYLHPDQTKEHQAKRIPIHADLVPILREVLKITCIGHDDFFLMKDRKGVRPIGLETFKNCWPRACNDVGLETPHPRFHDLRHTWRTNARRSGVDAQIAECIMGHWFRGKSVNDRYGRISEKELVDAINKMTFGHGDTEIWVSTPVKSNFPKKR